MASNAKDRSKANLCGTGMNLTLPFTEPES